MHAPKKQSEWCEQIVFTALTRPNGRQVTRQTAPRNCTHLALRKTGVKTVIRRVFLELRPFHGLADRGISF